jgi:8-oxo-dGTP pyrophosphatase MutT (NUDIX family)
MHNYIEVNAAGGLVTNDKGEFLLIRRSGLWDLPKGHQEPGEALETTALREVEEETGLHGLILGDFIRTTDHTYMRNDRLHLKHTWWYLMRCPECQDFIPQTEEGITEVRWVSKTELQKHLLQTYPTIIEVFRSIGLSEKFLPSVKQNSENFV